jgi:hypothetical protein
MKIQINSVCFGARWLLVLLAGIMVIPGARAQSADQSVDNRLLLVFDTSSNMKKRLDAEEKSVKELFAITLNGKFRAGDSVGVWTFSHDLHTGQFPLQAWEPEDILTMPGNIVDFMKNRHYSKTTTFENLMPLIQRVVSNSSRLTIVIYCDGDGEVKGTPYDDTINSVLKQNSDQMKKNREPFVIVLRSQFGKYVACTINTSDNIDIPQFPPLPQPPAPPATPPPPPPPPQPALAPLIIIGNTVTNSLPPPPQQQPTQPAPAPVAPPRPINPAPPSAAAEPSPAPVPVATLPSNPAPQTNTTLPVVVSPMLTNSAVASAEPASPAPAPVAEVSPENSGAHRTTLFAAGGALLAVAVLTGFWMMRRSRSRDSASLITESLKKR